MADNLRFKQGLANHGTAKFDAEHHFLLTSTTWLGTEVLTVGVNCKSMSNASERADVRRVANEMLRLCDEGDNNGR